MSGNGVRVIKQRSDEEVVQMCVTMLGRMFPEKVSIRNRGRRKGRSISFQFNREV